MASKAVPSSTGSRAKPRRNAHADARPQRQRKQRQRSEPDDDNAQQHRQRKARRHIGQAGALGIGHPFGQLRRRHFLQDQPRQGQEQQRDGKEQRRFAGNEGNRLLPRLADRDCRHI